MYCAERAPVLHLINNHLHDHIFLPIITRDTPGLAPKPDPAGILHIADQWGLDDGGRSLIMVSNPLSATVHGYIYLIRCLQVGDSIDDMTAGHMAGAVTVLLLNERNRHLVNHEHTDLSIERLDDLIGILDEGRVIA